MTKKDKLIYPSIIILYAVCVGILMTIDVTLAISLGLLIPLAIFATIRKNEIPKYVIITFFSAILIPGLPERFNLFYALTALLVFFFYFDEFLNKNHQKEPKVGNKWLSWFMVVVIVTVITRGFGLQFLGSEKIGGFSYIQIFLIYGLFLTLPLIDYSAEKIKKILLIFALMPIIPFILENLLTFGIGSADSFIFKVININKLLLDPSNITSKVRISSGFTTSKMLLTAILIYYPLTNKQNLRKLLLGLAIALFIAGLSGHRAALVFLLMYIVIYLYLNNFIRKHHYIILAIIGIIALGVMIEFIKYMPFAIQRTFSVIPFLDISNEVKSTALSTSEWRLIIWDYALSEIPDFWLMGKGLAFTFAEKIPRWFGSHYSWAIITRNYHNGPLSLLITLGVFGSIFFILFLYKVNKFNYLTYKSKFKNSSLKHLHTVIYAYFLTEIAFFITIFGDVHISIPRLIFIAAILNLILNTEKKTSKNENFNRNSDL